MRVHGRHHITATPPEPDEAQTEATRTPDLKETGYARIISTTSALLNSRVRIGMDQAWSQMAKEFDVPVDPALRRLFDEATVVLLDVVSQHLAGDLVFTLIPLVKRELSRKEHNK